MDPITLAATVVVSLLRPYIELGAKKASEIVTDKVGKAAADFAVGTASKAWNYVKSALKSDKEKSAVASFENYPKDTEGLLKKVLTEKLQQDKELAQKLEELVNAQGPDGSTSTQIMNTGIAGIVVVNGDVSGDGTTITGLLYNASPTPSPSEHDHNAKNDT